MGGLFGNFGGCNGGMTGNMDYCTLIFLLFLINQCGCNDITWLVMLLLLCGCNNTQNCR